MSEEQIKEILVTLINKDKIANLGSGRSDSAEKNVEEVVKAYKTLKEEIGPK